MGVSGIKLYCNTIFTHNNDLYIWFQYEKEFVRMCKKNTKNCRHVSLLKTAPPHQYRLVGGNETLVTNNVMNIVSIVNLPLILSIAILINVSLIEVAKNATLFILSFFTVNESYSFLNANINAT